MDTYNTTISLADKTTAAAVMRMIDIESSEVIDGETVRSGYADRTIQVNIAPGEDAEEASYFLSTGDRVIVVSTNLDSCDQWVYEFDNLADAFLHADQAWYHLTPRERKENTVEVQIVGPDHGAVEEDGYSIVEDIRAVIARYDAEIPAIIAEMDEEDEE